MGNFFNLNYGFCEMGVVYGSKYDFIGVGDGQISLRGMSLYDYDASISPDAIDKKYEYATSITYEYNGGDIDHYGCFVLIRPGCLIISDTVTVKITDETYHILKSDPKKSGAIVIEFFNNFIDFLPVTRVKRAD